jgi:hypothetical protein
MRNLSNSSQDKIKNSDRDFDIEIFFFPFPDIRLLDDDLEKEIAFWTAMKSRISPACIFEIHAIVDASGYFYLQLLGNLLHTIAV